jgi:excisionase family DNA binding protein
LRNRNASASSGERTSRLLNLTDGARYLSVSYWTLRGLLHTGQIPYVRIGRRLLVDRVDLDEFISSSKIREPHHYHRGPR